MHLLSRWGALYMRVLLLSIGNLIIICVLTTVKLAGTIHCMNNVRHIRQTLGLSQDALAEALGMTQGSVSQYELGSDIPPRVARKLIDVAAGRGVDISFDDIYTSEAA